jgi:hypothetical protein
LPFSFDIENRAAMVQTICDLSGITARLLEGHPKKPIPGVTLAGTIPLGVPPIHGRLNLTGFRALESRHLIGSQFLGNLD